jgi:hypothetical protein
MAGVAPAASLALVLVLALPGLASAQRCVARPGTAALDQYCETIPGSSGSRPSARGGGSRLRDLLPDALVARFERHGEEGRAVLALSPGPTALSAAARERSRTPPRERSAQASPALVETDAPPDAPSANPLTASVDALGLAGALGWGLVVALGVFACLAAAAAFAAGRRA